MYFFFIFPKPSVNTKLVFIIRERTATAYKDVLLNMFFLEILLCYYVCMCSGRVINLALLKIGAL